MKFGKCISPNERIVATLRFSATSDAQKSLSFLFQLCKTTPFHTISETYDVKNPVMGA